MRDLQERLAIEKEAWEENYMKKQVCVKYIFVFILLLVHCLASVCIGDCFSVPVRAHVSVHVCVLKSHCSSPQEATLLAKERGLRENLRLERDKVSGGGVGGWGGLDLSTDEDGLPTVAN